jgi:hypothetical protein
MKTMAMARAAAVTAGIVVLTWWCVRTFSIYAAVVESLVVAVVALSMIAISIIRSLRHSSDRSDRA